MKRSAPSLAEVLDILHEIAPLELAAEWDNVGLLVQPNARAGKVGRLLLTIDLTDAVVAEAKAARADLVVAYHPPIFQGMKRLCADDGKQRAVLLAAAAGLPVYSPHTALDAAPGGIADWLAEGMFGGEPSEDLRPCGEGDFGRVVGLQRPVPFARLLLRIKKRLGVRALQVARPAKAQNTVRRVAVAAGAGGSVLLGEHSNTERGYLRVLRRRLRAPFGSRLDVRIARADRDPFTLV